MTEEVFGTGHLSNYARLLKTQSGSWLFRVLTSGYIAFHRLAMRRTRCLQKT